MRTSYSPSSPPSILANQTMKRIIRSIGIAALVLLVFIGSIIWINYMSARQDRLDHALILAIRAENNSQILEALAQGADGEATDTYNQPTTRMALLQLFDRLRQRNHVKSEEHLSALVMLYCDSFKKMNDKHDGKPWPGPDPMVVRALLDHGASVDDGDESNKTSLCYASEFSNGEVVQLLLERGANIEAQDKYYGYRPLMDASIVATGILLDHGANINAVNKSNQTALMLAASRGEVEIMRILLEHGAQDNIRDSFGSTALDLAKHCLQSTPAGKRKMVDLLNRYASKHIDK